jgi:mannose-6-phosphate isomerase-like protein (cupin superfamily)
VEANERTPIHVAPNDGRKFWLVGDLITLKMVSSDTDGAFALVEEVTPPQGGPPPHIHTREDETFYVLDGELEFVIGGRVLLATAGSVVYGPKGIPHAFRNVGTTPSTMVVFIAPAGFERMIEEVGELATDPSSPPEGPPNIERLVALNQKYGVDVPPPREQ